jgi:LuxR family maltose regulon positive regulatory protein
MEELTFLSDKFAPAELPYVCAPRIALLGSFDALKNERAIFVSAPAGSGKTVSTLLWIKACARRAVWIGLDEYDNSLSTFFKLLATGLFSTQPDNDAMRAVLTNPAFSASPVEYTIALISEMRPVSVPSVLVFDDLHLVGNSEIFKALPIVLRRLPRSFITIILSRFDPPELLTSLIRPNAANLFTAETLRFSEDEIHEYFRSHGRELTPEETHAAFNITEGWAIGVNAITKSGELSGSLELSFAHYFESQIWDKWPGDLRDFCIATAVADEFDPKLAALLSGRADSAEILQRLTRTNSFISCLHDDVYRYHHLFQDFLREKLCAMPMDYVSRLYKQIAEYYKEKRDYTRALRFWTSSGDWKGLDTYLLLFLFRNNRGNISDYADFLRSFFDKGFPKTAYEEAPALHVLAAWFYYITSRPDKFASHMDAIVANLPAIAQAGNEFLEFSILAFSVDHRQTMAQKEELYELFSQFLSDYTPEGLATNFISYTHSLPYINRSNVDYNEFALDPLWAEKLGCTFAPLLGTEWEYLRQHMDGVFEYERNRLPEARLLNNQAMDIIKPSHKIEGRMCVALLNHTLAWHMGTSEQAEAALDNLWRFARTQMPDFLPNLKAYTTKLALFSGDSTAAGDWLDEYFVIEPQQIELFKVFQHFTTVRARLALGEIETSLSLIERLIDYGINLNRPLDECEARLLLSLTKWHTGDKAGAAAEMTRVLTITQEYGYIRMIADEGAAALPILRRVMHALPPDSELNRSYVNEVLLAAHSFAKTHPGYLHAPGGAAHKPIKLSKQQTKLLSLLSLGCRYSEICNIMGLKLPTVKTHASLLYKKLGVNNSSDAILKARQLGLPFSSEK